MHRIEMIVNRMVHRWGSLLVFTLISLCFLQNGIALPEFVQVYGGNNDTEANAVFVTEDRGYVVTGYTESYGADGKDLIIVRYDFQGNVLWTKILGGPDDEEGNDVIQVSDGGFVVVGYTYSCGSGGQDILLAKFTADGLLSWKYYLGFRVALQSKDEYGASIIEDSDGGLVITGATTTNPAVLRYDLFLAKFDADGIFTWAKKIYLTGRDHWGCSVIKTSEDGFLVSGGVIMSQVTMDKDVLLAKFDSGGSVDWVWRFWDDSADDDERACSLIRTEDNGYAFSGFIEEEPDNGYGPLYIYKLNAALTPQWIVRKSGDFTFGSIIEIDDDVYRIGGDSSSATASLLVHSYDRSTPTDWRYVTTGGSGKEVVNDLAETPSGDLVLTGSTDSWGAGGTDLLLVRSDSSGSNCLLNRVVVTSADDFAWGDIEIHPVSAPPIAHSDSCTLSVGEPDITREVICYEGTIECSFTCVPSAGTPPFVTTMCATLTNRYTEQYRTIAVHIDVQLANGTSYSNWRTGYANVPPDDSVVICWNQTIQDLPPLYGSNIFTLVAEDVTSAPYNQPPYPPSGDTFSDDCTLVVHQP